MTPKIPAIALKDMSAESRAATRPPGAISRTKSFHAGKMNAPRIPLSRDVTKSSQKLRYPRSSSTPTR